MAAWFISQADAGSSFSTHLAQLLGVTGQAGGFTTGLAATATTAVIAIVLGLLAFLGSVIQIMLMLVRGGMLVLLVGTLPLIAAFSNTEMGHQWFRKATAWLLAFALYKPAAAIIYAVAFKLGGQQGALALLDGVMMLILAILALPALLRFLVPATSALAAGGGTGVDARRRRRGGGDANAVRRRANPVRRRSTSYQQGQARIDRRHRRRIRRWPQRRRGDGGAGLVGAGGSAGRPGSAGQQRRSSGQQGSPGAQGRADRQEPAGAAGSQAAARRCGAAGGGAERPRRSAPSRSPRARPRPVTLPTAPSQAMTSHPSGSDAGPSGSDGNTHLTGGRTALSVETSADRTYGNWRRPRPPGLWHLGLISSVLLVVGVIVVIGVIALVGLLPGLLLLAVMLPFFLLTLKPDVHGQTPLQRVGVRARPAARSPGPLAPVSLRAARADAARQLSAAGAARRQPALRGPRRV